MNSVSKTTIPAMLATILAIGALSVAGSAQADGPPGPPTPPAVPEPGARALARLQALDLTAEQQDRIRAIHEAQRAERSQRGKELRRLEHALQGEMLEEDPSIDVLRDLVTRMADLRAREELARLEVELEVRKALTEEQRDRLLAMPPPPGAPRPPVRDGRGPHAGRPDSPPAPPGPPVGSPRPGVSGAHAGEP